MPTIELVAAPARGATSYDPTSDTTFRLGVPTFVDDPYIWERLQSVEPLGFRFEVLDNAAPADSAVATDQTAEQAAATPTAQES